MILIKLVIILIAFLNNLIGVTMVQLNNYTFFQIKNPANHDKGEGF